MAWPSCCDCFAISLNQRSLCSEYSCVSLICSKQRVTACTDSTDRKSTRLNSSHVRISYAVFCLKKINQSIVFTTGQVHTQSVLSSSVAASSLSVHTRHADCLVALSNASRFTSHPLMSPGRRPGI